MLIPHFTLHGDGAEQYVGLGKKLVNQISKAGIRSKTLQVGDGATIQAQQFGNTGKVRINTTGAGGGGPIVIQDFDSAIIRYTWYQNSGEDLDIVTYIATPNFKSDAVGWVTGNAYTPKTSSDMNNCYLFWNGDNTTRVGSEAILVNFKKLIDTYPELPEFQILMYANWYSELKDGKVLLQFETYQGGTFDSATEEYNILNTGGTLVQEFSKQVVVTLLQERAYPGQGIGTLTYTRATNQFSLV